MKYKYIIWDFNGTILNDVNVGIKSVNTLLEKRKLPLINNVGEYHKVFDFPIIGYYERIGFDFEKESYYDVAIEWVKEYLKNVTGAKLFPGILECIKNFRKLNLKQMILSATEINMLKTQLQNLKIIGYFDEILGLDNINAYSKIDIALNLLQKIDPAETILIGDTTHDYETAMKMGIDCVLIANGHQSECALLDCGVPVLKTVKDLDSFIMRL